MRDESNDIDPSDQAAVNAVLLDRSERIERAIFGNGQPGVLADVAALKAANARTTQKSGGLAAAITIALTVIMQKMGLA